MNMRHKGQSRPLCSLWITKYKSQWSTNKNDWVENNFLIYIKLKFIMTQYKTGISSSMLQIIKYDHRLKIANLLLNS